MAQRTLHPDTSFSRCFGIQRSPADDWFDPLLHRDTELFIDPFLMFDEASAPWNGIHADMLAFFNRAFEHIARSQGGNHVTEWNPGAEMFSFPEVPAFCLGYGKKTIFGSGSSRGIGLGMLRAADKAIKDGILNLDDFGDLMLFGEYFGCDRIGDMVWVRLL